MRLKHCSFVVFKGGGGVNELCGSYITYTQTSNDSTAILQKHGPILIQRATYQYY